jgi:hypothetical protein
VSLFWLIVILLGIVQASWIIEFYKAKYPRRVVLKDWFNSTVWALGGLSGTFALLELASYLGIINSLVKWSGFYSTWSSTYTEIIVSVNSGRYFFMVASVLLALAGILWGLSHSYKDIAIWKYTPEDIVIKDKYKEEKKEKNKKRLPAWLFKIMYPEKKKKVFKHPRLAKFFLMDIEDK